jgi:hypothetical protein
MTGVMAQAARLAPSAHADSLGGQWSTLSYLSCIPNAQNASFCLPNGQRQTILNPFFASSDAAGNITDDASIMLAEVAASSSPLCSPDIFGLPFTGTCIVSDHGSGVIKTGLTGLPDFWVNEETATFQGTPPVTVHDPFAPYPIDTGVPAAPGYYDTQHTLVLSGGLASGQTPPPGITSELAIAHGTGSSFPAVALPLAPNQSGGGVSNSFAVAFYGANGGRGTVLFGPGPGCSGLVEVATNDVFAGAKVHTVVVTGNDLPGTAGDNGIQAGATYWYETAVVTPVGVQVDDNGGKCYSVTVPK